MPDESSNGKRARHTINPILHRRDNGEMIMARDFDLIDRNSRQVQLIPRLITRKKLASPTSDGVSKMNNLGTINQPKSPAYDEKRWRLSRSDCRHIENFDASQEIFCLNHRAGVGCAEACLISPVNRFFPDPPFEFNYHRERMTYFSVFSW